MWGWEIEDFLKIATVTKRAYGGVFHPETLPTAIEYPIAIVINVDHHWVAVYIDCFKKGYYFDSFGLPPLNVRVRRFLDTFSDVWSHSQIPIQCVTSSKCGHFCLFFLVYKCMGWGINQILRPFKRYNVKINDHFVKRWLQNKKLGFMSWGEGCVLV